MNKFKNKYRIESNRLQGYDYSQPGAYFITICTKDRLNLFGKIIDGKMLLNECGKIVKECLYDLPNHYNNLSIDESIIMPNHIHTILFIVETGLRPVSTKIDNVETVETGLRPVSTEIDNHFNHGVSEFIRALKSFSTRRINEKSTTLSSIIWQRNYYDHIIRNEKELNLIRQYIINNPLQWVDDEYYS